MASSHLIRQITTVVYDGSQCGSCAYCCTAAAIPLVTLPDSPQQAPKGPGVPCWHLRESSGGGGGCCGVYGKPERPIECSNYACAYVLAENPAWRLVLRWTWGDRFPYQVHRPDLVWGAIQAAHHKAAEKADFGMLAEALRHVPLDLTSGESGAARGEGSLARGEAVTVSPGTRLPRPANLEPGRMPGMPAVPTLLKLEEVGELAIRSGAVMAAVRDNRMDGGTTYKVGLHRLWGETLMETAWGDWWRALQRAGGMQEVLTNADRA